MRPNTIYSKKDKAGFSKFYRSTKKGNLSKVSFSLRANVVDCCPVKYDCFKDYSHPLHKTKTVRCYTAGSHIMIYNIMPNGDFNTSKGILPPRLVNIWEEDRVLLSL